MDPDDAMDWIEDHYTKATNKSKHGDAPCKPESNIRNQHRQDHVVSNPRTDYGDFDGLAADIAARGLLEPLDRERKWNS